MSKPITDEQKAAFEEALKDPEFSMRVAEMLDRADDILLEKERREGKDPVFGPIMRSALRSFANLAGKNEVNVTVLEERDQNESGEPIFRPPRN